MSEQLNGRIRAELTRRKLNPRSAAERAGLSSGTIHKWLRHPDTRVDAAALRKLANFFEWPEVDAFVWAGLLSPPEPRGPLDDIRRALEQGPWSERARSSLYDLAAELERAAQEPVALMPEDLPEPLRRAIEDARGQMAAGTPAPRGAQADDIFLDRVRRHLDRHLQERAR